MRQGFTCLYWQNIPAGVPRMFTMSAGVHEREPRWMRMGELFSPLSFASVLNLTVWAQAAFSRWITGIRRSRKGRTATDGRGVSLGRHIPKDKMGALLKLRIKIPWSLGPSKNSSWWGRGDTMVTASNIWIETNFPLKENIEALYGRYPARGSHHHWHQAAVKGTVE